MSNANSRKAHEYIRERILEGAFPPGYRLQTVDLARKIGVSRTPVRDALRELQGEGLVSISPRVGACVRSLDSKEFREMCELRLALESLAAELAARNRNLEDLIEIQDAVEAMDREAAAFLADPGNEATAQALMRLDLRFHFAILKAARNRLVRAEILRLHLLNRVVWTSATRRHESTPERADREQRIHWIQDCHRRIFTAIKGQDPEGARKAMHAHIREILEHRILAVVRLESTPDSLEKAHQDAPDAYSYLAASIP